MPIDLPEEMCLKPLSLSLLFRKHMLDTRLTYVQS